MRSIKPGRGPSMMSGVSGIFAALFGVFWTIIAVSMGAFIMVPFGLIFIGIAVTQAIYNIKNATSKNRYSAFDITDYGDITGHYGSLTQNAVKKFQKARGLTQGQPTRRKIRRSWQLFRPFFPLL